MPTPTVDLVHHAERLAADLAAPPANVGRNVLLSILADFMGSGRTASLSRLRRTLSLLAAGSGGHIERGESYGQQVCAAVAVLEGLLDGADFEVRELQTLFGWTARLLLVRDQPREGGARRAGPSGPARGERRKGEPWSGPGAPGGSMRRVQKGQARPGRPAAAAPPRAPLATKIDVVDAKTRRTLEELRQRLKATEEDGGER